MSKVNAAVRMLGSGFFHDVTGAKKVKGKIYDTHTLLADDGGESEQVLVAEEGFEDDFVDQLAAEGDDDAILVCEYESAMQDTIQEDEELAQAYNAYTEARKRLSDRFKNRGFWPGIAVPPKGNQRVPKVRVREASRETEKACSKGSYRVQLPSLRQKGSLEIRMSR